MLIQIYGITTPDDAWLVQELGADHAGVVLDEGVDTWDSVDLETGRAIAAALSHTTVVALSLSPEEDRIRRTVEALEPGIVHMARAAGRLSPEAVGRIGERIAPVRTMVTVPVVGREAIGVARSYQGSCDFLLLDSRDPGTGVVGATGRTHDWDLSAEVVASVDVPVFLAGGLGPDNVAEAIRRVAPAGVDSETHTSLSADRRRKDPDRLRRFVEIVRGLEGVGTLSVTGS